MNRLQIVVIGSAVLLFFVLYFGCDTKPQQQQLLEKSRALITESTDVKVLEKEAKEAFSENQLAELGLLEEALITTTEDSARVEVLQQLSGFWYRSGRPAIAGYYAQEIAEIANTEESWSIAGTTYTLCLQTSQEEKIRSYCSARSVQAFENAISLNPDNVANKVNLALSYTEAPPKDNPMKGVLMLRELNEAYPSNVLVLNSLARLAIKTGQYERAVQRLEAALELDPDNQNTICLLAVAYQEAGQLEKASRFVARCKNSG